MEPNLQWRQFGNFSDAEYERRHSAVREELADRGLDALIVTTWAHQVWVAGDPHNFQAASRHLGFQPVILTMDSSYSLVRKYEEASAGLDSAIEQVIGYSADVENPADPVEVVASALSDLGLSSGRIGYEGALGGLAAADLLSLERLMQAEFVEAADIVRDLAHVKSPEEIELMKHVGAISAAGAQAFIDTVEPGVKESTVATAVLSAMYEKGSEQPFYSPWILSGERAAIPHATWSDKEIESGESVCIEVSGSLHHYHSPLARTVVVGDNPDAVRLFELATEAHRAGFEKLRPGMTTGDVDDAARGVIRDAGYGDWFRHRFGYGVGIDWMSRGAMALAPQSDDVLEVGMSFHVITNLMMLGEYAAFLSDAVIVTEGEPLILSGFDRSLVCKGGKK